MAILQRARDNSNPVTDSGRAGARPIHSVTDDSTPAMRALRSVTVFCRNCGSEIHVDGTAYRGTSWDITVCESCYQSELQSGRSGFCKDRLVGRECEWCSRTCYTRPGDFLISRFCSIGCQRRYLRRRKLRSLTCSCGNEFRQSRPNQLHCSQACKQRAYRERQHIPDATA